MSVLEPVELTDKATGKCSTVSEVKAYGEVVLRFVSGDFAGPFLPNFEEVDIEPYSFGLQRIDHCVGNVPELFEVTDYLMKITGARRSVTREGSISQWDSSTG